MVRKVLVVATWLILLSGVVLAGGLSNGEFSDAVVEMCVDMPCREMGFRTARCMWLNFEKGKACDPMDECSQTAVNKCTIPKNRNKEFDQGIADFIEAKNNAEQWKDPLAQKKGGRRQEK